MLRASARKASKLLGVSVGSLRAGAAADIVVTDYKPFTPMNASNASAHFLFGMSSRQVRHVIVDGDWVVKDRSLAREDAAVDAAIVQDATRRLWQKMVGID
jgi:cytosine/adenosine deaminase-related metal-dependent hydrolase